MKRLFMGLTIAMFAIALCGTSAFAAGSIGGRVWFADYDYSIGSGGESEEVEGGNDPMYMIQLNQTMGERVSGALLLGYGSGWDEEEVAGIDLTVTRFDGLAGLSYRFEMFYLGVGAHVTVVQHEQDSKFDSSTVDVTYAYVGPELMAGTSVPVIPDLLAINASASIIPVMGWAVDVSVESPEGDGDDDDSGTTWGYSADVGAALMLGQWMLGAGYRYQTISEYDVTIEGDGGSVDYSQEDEFSGFYVSAGLGW